MTQPEAAVVAAAIVGSVSLIGALVAAAVALRNESRQRLAVRRDAETQALRSQAAETFRYMFLLQHEMEWLTWHAVHRPKDVGPRMAEIYESAVHNGYPKLLGAMAVLASLDMESYKQIVPLVERIYDAENQVGQLLAGLDSRRKRGNSVRLLGQLNGPIKALYVDLPPAMAEAMQRGRHEISAGDRRN